MAAARRPTSPSPSRQAVMLVRSFCVACHSPPSAWKLMLTMLNPVVQMKTPRANQRPGRDGVKDHPEPAAEHGDAKRHDLPAPAAEQIAGASDPRILNRINDPQQQERRTQGGERNAQFAGIEVRRVQIDRYAGKSQWKGKSAIHEQRRPGQADLRFWCQEFVPSSLLRNPGSDAA